MLRSCIIVMNCVISNYYYWILRSCIIIYCVIFNNNNYWIRCSCVVVLILTNTNGACTCVRMDA